MKNNNIPLVIILKKIQNGYAFQSIEEVSANKQKNKKSKFGRKPAIKNAPNRLIKQIGIASDALASHMSPPQQPSNIQAIQEEHQHQQNHPIFHVHEQQSISCEVQRQTELPKIPALWFNKQNIHEIQKKQMKQFFSESNSNKSQLYLKYRNFMVDSYLLNPKRYLTKIACRKILRGDVNSIMRVHAFLEKHGIINFSVGYDGNYKFKPNCFTTRFQNKSNAPFSFKKSLQSEEQTAQKQIDTDNMTITVINKNFSRTYRASCTLCKLICGIVWFANVNQEESQKNLCFQCYIKLDEKQKNFYVKVDILKKMQSHSKEGKNAVKNAWNIEENIKLLDFMANSRKQSWKKIISSFGGKRTIQDIVLQFLQFPISNFQVNKTKNLLQSELNNNKEQASIGYNQNDYKNILQSFFNDSKFKNKKFQKTQKNQIKQQPHSASKLQINVKQQTSIKSQNSIQQPPNSKKQQCQQISNALTMITQKMLVKINGLKKYDQIVRTQLKQVQNLMKSQNQNQKIEQVGNKNKNKDLQAEKDLVLKNNDSKNNDSEGKSKGVKYQNQNKCVQSSQVLVSDEIQNNL